MKRIVSLILALSMVLSMFTMSFAGLKDVEGTSYEAAVDALIELGVVAGYPDGTYLPENVVTRAELAKLLVVAYGLEPAAEASKGATAFSDIGADHWASGYVNVSADYKFVNGYPEGTFKGDATVTYAEAITMCLRVLGYANEIDAKGTWPTNYIAKAQDLKLMEGIEFGSYNDGAKRGNVALLIWNMLTTKMWEVGSESEGDGLVSAPNREMLEVKFPDYKYEEEMLFESWNYNPAEGKVFVSLSGEASELEYAKNDFYTLVPGTEVSALYKKDNKVKELLSVVPTEDNVLVDGAVIDLEEKYTNYSAEDFATYAYLLLDANKKSAAVEGAVEIFGGASEYVTKVEEKTNYTKITTTADKYSIEPEEEADVLVIYGDERLSLVDLEVGDVITWIDENVAVLSRKTEEGSFDSLTYEEVANDSRTFIKLAGDEFEGIENLTVAKADEKNEGEFLPVEVIDLLPKKNDYLGEDATLFFNFVDEVVRMEFGVVDASEVNGDFFMATTGSTWSVADEEGAVWYVKLANEEGTESYKYEEGKENITFVAGEFYWVEFNDDGEIEAATLVSAHPETEDFDLKSFSGEMDEDTKYISGDKVQSSTKVFTARQLEDEDGELINKYELVVTEGPKELEGIASGELALVADTIRVAYAFVKGESTSADKDYGIIEKYYIEAGITYIVIDGETYELSGSSPVDPYAGSIVAFTIDSKDRIKVWFEYDIDEIANAGRVTKIDETIVEINSGEATIDLDLVPEQYEDYRAFRVEVDYDNDNNAIFESIEEIGLDEIAVRKDYGVAITNPLYTSIEAFIVIEGIDWAE